MVFREISDYRQSFVKVTSSPAAVVRATSTRHDRTRTPNGQSPRVASVTGADRVSMDAYLQSIAVRLLLFFQPNGHGAIANATMTNKEPRKTLDPAHKCYLPISSPNAYIFVQANTKMPILQFFGRR